MNRFIIFLIAALMSQLAFAQGWEQQVSPTTNALDAVVFVDSSLGWAVGGAEEVGTILHTTNGGIDWTIQNSGTTHLLTDVDFVDSIHGWAVGSSEWEDYPFGIHHSSVILRTTNGGEVWTTQVSDSGSYLTGVDFYDLNNGWAVGSSDYPSYCAVILRTSDGGVTWTTQTSDSGYCLSGLDFVDADNGWAVGGRMDSFPGFSGGIIRHTTDGGQTWSIQDLTEADPFLWDVDFVDLNNGWAVGHLGGLSAYDYVVRTADGGETWTAQVIGEGLMSQAVDFADMNHGWVVGCMPPILHTTDGGNTWANENSGAWYWVYGVDFVDANNGWAVGGDGTILHYSAWLVLAPEHLVINPIGENVRLRWDAVPGAGIQYNVYCDSIANGAFTQLLGTTTDTIFVDTAIALKKFYVVRAERP